MKKNVLTALGLVVSAALSGPQASGLAGQQAGRPAGQQLDAAAIMEKNFQASKVSGVRLEASMVLINDKGQQRERKNTTVVALQDNGVDSKFAVRFSTPADIKGTSFLQVEHSEGDDDLWIYLPALRKSRRLVASNKKDSFVGSDFSYGDISLPKVAKYRHTITRTEPMDGVDCYVIESLPGDDTVKANSGYSKKITWVRSDNFVETKVEYYDLAGRLLKTQRVTKPQVVDAKAGRYFPLSREMTNHQTGHRTTLNVLKLDTNVPTPDELFTTRYIERDTP
jgi:outer membrane lipoprotein-sorting protein